MSRLKIVDLSFCESQLSNSNQVTGGTVATSLSTSFQAATIAKYSGLFSVNNGVISVKVSGIAAGSAAGAAAAAASDGSVFSSTFASAKAS